MCALVTYPHQFGEAVRLGYDFYNRHVVEVAQDLLGKSLFGVILKGLLQKQKLIGARMMRLPMLPVV